MVHLGNLRDFLFFFFFFLIQDNFHNLGPSQRALTVLIKFKIILSFSFSKIFIDINWCWVKTIPWWRVLRSKIFFILLCVFLEPSKLLLPLLLLCSITDPSTSPLRFNLSPASSPWKVHSFLALFICLNFVWLLKFWVSF